MSRKIIFIDFDKTFLIDKEIKNDTFIYSDIEYLNSLTKLGHVVVFITGRSYLLTKLIVDQFPNNNFYIACFNGAYIYKIIDKHSIEVLKNSTFDTNDIKEIIEKELSENYIVNIIQETRYQVFLNNENDYIANEYLSKLNDYVTINSNKEIQNDILGLYVRLINSKINKDELINHLNIKFSKYHFWHWTTIINDEITLEINLKNNNKAHALQFITNYLNFDIKDTIAFGDNINDLEMIRIANFGIAMKNGKQMIKDVANDITDEDNNNSGVVNYLRKIL